LGKRRSAPLKNKDNVEPGEPPDGSPAAAEGSSVRSDPQQHAPHEEGEGFRERAAKKRKWAAVTAAVDAVMKFTDDFVEERYASMTPSKCLRMSKKLHELTDARDSFVGDDDHPTHTFRMKFDKASDHTLHIGLLLWVLKGQDGATVPADATGKVSDKPTDSITHTKLVEYINDAWDIGLAIPKGFRFTVAASQVCHSGLLGQALGHATVPDPWNHSLDLLNPAFAGTFTRPVTLKVLRLDHPAELLQESQEHIIRYGVLEHVTGAGSNAATNIVPALNAVLECSAHLSESTLSQVRKLLSFFGELGVDSSFTQALAAKTRSSARARTRHSCWP
jgi:hypothetical protein